MARPIKVGLDYFPLDVTLEDKIELLEAECGLVGFAILIKLWQKIYSNGYYTDWTEDNSLLFARKINAELTTVNDVINVCFKRCLLNEKLYKKHKILTSKGIQERYFKVCSDSKRKSISVIKEYILVNPESMPINSEITEINSEFSTQRKGEERKGEESSKTIYSDVFDYYISKDIVKHKQITDDMKKAIDLSAKELKFDLDYFKRIIDRHKIKLESTKYSDKPIKPRTLAELFGQKKYKSVSLICTDYLDEVWQEQRLKVFNSDYVDPNPFNNRGE